MTVRNTSKAWIRLGKSQALRTAASERASLVDTMALPRAGILSRRCGRFHAWGGGAAQDCLAYLAADKAFHEQMVASSPIFDAVRDAIESKAERP